MLMKNKDKCPREVRVGNCRPSSSAIMGSKPLLRRSTSSSARFNHWNWFWTRRDSEVGESIVSRVRTDRCCHVPGGKSRPNGRRIMCYIAGNRQQEYIPLWWGTNASRLCTIRATSDNVVLAVWRQLIVDKDHIQHTYRRTRGVC